MLKVELTDSCDCNIHQHTHTHTHTGDSPMSSQMCTLCASSFAPSKALCRGCVFLRESCWSAFLTRRQEVRLIFMVDVFLFAVEAQSPYRALSLLIGALAFEMPTVIRPRAWCLSPLLIIDCCDFKPRYTNTHTHTHLEYCSHPKKILAYNSFATKPGSSLNINAHNYLLFVWHEGMSREPVPAAPLRLQADMRAFLYSSASQYSTLTSLF